MMDYDNNIQSGLPRDSGALIVGEYGAGAYGPTIMMKLTSERSVEWLHDVMTRLASQIGVSVDLTKLSEVRIKGVRTLVLRSVEKSGGVALRGGVNSDAGGVFEWELDLDGWTSAAEMLEPFLRGQVGHQYLTQERRDSALVVVSFGESDVRVADGRET